MQGIKDILDALKQLQSTIYLACDAKPADDISKIVKDAVAEITSLREQLEKAKKDGWISVDTALPDYDSVRQKRLRVLVHWKDTGVVFTLWYGKRFGHNKASFFEENDWDESDYGQIDEGDNLLFGDTLTYKNITHWQPLPEPPKE